MTQNGFAIARAVARAMDNSYTAHAVLQTGAQKVVQSLAGLFQIRAMQIQAGLNRPTVAFQIAQDIGATDSTQMSYLVAFTLHADILVRGPGQGRRTGGRTYRVATTLLQLLRASRRTAHDYALTAFFQGGDDRHGLA